MSRDAHGADAPAESPRPPRLESVDLLRGLVMVLMALDHTREFFFRLSFDPLDVEQTHPALFLTRWLTHLCAPVFVFLAGTSAFLSTTRGKSIRELSWFLLTRGLWLVLLELTYVNWLGWRFDFNLHAYGAQVIWVIGWSMVALAGLVWLPRWAVMTFGLALIALHNAFDGLKPESFGALANLWRILHVPGALAISPGIQFGIGYPLIPWVGVMAAGYAMAPELLRAAPARRRFLLRWGAAATILFVALRFTNLYGDPERWSAQSSPLFTVFSFLNCQKYPPSLCFLLMTLGPALLLLALFDREIPAVLRPLLVFGRVPLFFYLVHLPLINALRLLAASAWGGGLGFELGGVYLVWLVIVGLLYPACRWFDNFKRTHRGAWVSYL